MKKKNIFDVYLLLPLANKLLCLFCVKVDVHKLFYPGVNFNFNQSKPTTDQ